jgi:hypothetical protein
MFVSYVVKNMESKDKIQILNCSSNRNQLWNLMWKTAQSYKDEINVKENLSEVEIVEDKDNFSIIIKGLVTNTVSGIIWNSQQTVEIVILSFKIQETNETVHINKNLNTNLYDELQKKILARRKSIESE